ncbi:LAMI_0C06942g1_1 [Lachancea mirantina]|uniref:RNA exonuclease 4 n=1 Tax=Lachancea mirantina TaxID=1230905 RepID=A0A1G4J3H2_9SACH|nr:LAMI_0C06942g1_1 [Lachancea mirantina]
MVLSSNWLQLQKTQNGGKTKKNKVSKKPTVKSRDAMSHDRNKKIETKSSKIMNMVHTMNQEIQKLKTEKNNSVNGSEPEVVSLDVEKIAEINGSARNTSKADEIGKFIAMDCEFVGVGPEGIESALARVSIVNFFGHVVLDIFVKPVEKVTDWRTWISGVTPAHMKDAVSLNDAQQKVSKILDKRILVGHAIAHDLDALFLSHPRSMIRDTSRHLPFRRDYAKGKTPSLKKLAKEILGVDIQGAQHSSVEDARATMLIYKSDRKEFERLIKVKFSSNKQAAA